MTEQLQGKTEWEITETGENDDPHYFLELQVSFLNLMITPMGPNAFEVDITQLSDGEVIRTTGLEGYPKTLEAAKAKAFELAEDVLKNELQVLSLLKAGQK
ncbi:MAG: hypothetical protein J0I20_33765 [Chloroflexi bacterium]|nr:hypothetical protein [Chloroflexota bacterium]OJW05570.1 MAG: hypothetical protein BGO39_02840 [Chloroflexi bacterium 54-19]